MIDSLLQITFSNVIFALFLAAFALLAGRLNRPRLSHLLWLFVFIKLLPPSFVSLPILTADNPVEVVSENKKSSKQKNNQKPEQR